MLVYDLNKKRETFINVENIETVTPYGKSELNSKTGACIIEFSSGRQVNVHQKLFKALCEAMNKK